MVPTKKPTCKSPGDLHEKDFTLWKYNVFTNKNVTHFKLTCSKSTIETLEKGVKYIQNLG